MSVTRKDANQLKKGNYILLDGDVHRIISEPQHSKSGKHGHAKIRVDSENIFTGKKTSSTFPASQSCEIPNIDKRNAQVTHVDDTSVGLMDNESFESFDVALPEDKDIVARLAADVDVEYWVILEKRFITRVI